MTSNTSPARTTPTRPTRERVLVAMSGGVDSAVAAALLHRQGYDVIGVTLRLYTEPDEAALRSGRTCCGIEDIGDARAAADAIGIPHYVLNMEREFERDVLDAFVSSYANGETPNPCLNCNQYVKFDTLLQRAIAMGVDRLATGHYARIEHDGDVVRLHVAEDADKDQSYVLYTLDQDALRRTIFPLGGLTKPQVREVARAAGLPLADKPDSVDICFVPGGDYREILQLRGVESAPGAIERTDGTVIGTHEGIHGYTVGQRRGLGIAQGPAADTANSNNSNTGAATTQRQRSFVTQIDAKRNVIVIGGEGDLYRRTIEARDPHWVVDPPEPGEPLVARIRYHAQDAEARVTAIDGDTFTVEFPTPVRAPAPGQAIVLYRGTEVVGGGKIARTTR